MFVNSSATEPSAAQNGIKWPKTYLAKCRWLMTSEPSHDGRLKHPELFLPMFWLAQAAQLPTVLVGSVNAIFLNPTIEGLAGVCGSAFFDSLI